VSPADAPRKRVFKRLETDAEFRKRLLAANVYVTTRDTSETLDELAWRTRQMQRKIVDDEN
jgi:hypothetical protein